MHLLPGTRLGPYEILASLGAGGMGEVYRARDTRLGRLAAIKVLRPHVAADPDARRRFEREARAVSTLNHPNICTLYDVGEQDGVDYIVMECLDGETLASRLAGSPMPMEQALRHGIAIADALAAAHRRLIIHRDLKPGNVMLTSVGPKVLDFGLAKFVRSEGSSADPDETLAHTQAIMGTPAYMAPEQLSGQRCDERTDIFALGLLLCEMTTGRRASAGEALPELPAHLAHVVEHCLSRDPAARWQSAADLKLALEWSGTVLDSRSSSPRSVDGKLMRLTVVLGPDAVPGLRTTAVLSNDGQRVAFLARGPDGIPRLATRPFDEVQPALLSGTENAQDPFFSPDGQWLGFFADYKLKRVSIHGGSPVVLCEAPNGRGASWGADDAIVVAPHIQGGLYRIAAGGGAPKPLTHPKGDEVSHAWPQILPGGETVLFTAAAGNHSNIQFASVRTGETKVVAGSGYRGRYLSSGHLVFVHQSTMFAVPFDIATLETRGVPVPVLADIADDANDRTAHFDCSGNGTLAYLSRKTVSSLRTLAWMDRSGRIEPLLDLPAKYSYISPSPDGKRLAFVSGFPEHIFVYDFQRGHPSRLTFATTGNVWPQWSPEGTHLVFSAQNGRPGGRTIWWVHANGAGEPQTLIESEEELHPSSVSPDGRHIAVHRRSPDTLYDIWILPIDTSDPEHPKAGALELFLRTPINEWGAVFSPNGRWISYYSEASGTGEIYVRPFRGSGGPWLVSAGSGISGTTAHWPRRGRSLFYLNSDRRIMEVTYSEEGNTFAAEEPRVWSPTPLPLAAFNMASDGERAIIAVPADSEEPRHDLQVTFLLNFFDELNRRVPVR